LETQSQEDKENYMKLTVKIVSVVTIIVLCISSITSCESPEDYYKDSNWSCTNEEFNDMYMPAYLAKIEELKQKYNIECTQIFEEKDYKRDVGYKIYLFSDAFTIDLFFANRSFLSWDGAPAGGYGAFRVHLYYYGNEAVDLKDYEKQRTLVDFINEFTRYVAFDTRSEECDNHFERLYLDCIKNGEEHASYVIHFDELIDYVYYGVDLEICGAEWWYKMQKDHDVHILSNSFEFEGILKPLW